VGDEYDLLYPSEAFETETAVTVLAALAHAHGGKSAIEFGIGTGRIALGLHRLGLAVSGIDGSERMVAQLRRKPQGASIPVWIGDFRSTCIGETAAVVVLVFNGIFHPSGRAAQLEIFRNAARHLLTGGFFVVETLVLGDRQQNGQWSISPRYVGRDHVELQALRFDSSSRRLERNLIHIRPQGLRVIPTADIYVSPQELDELAEATGFQLADRRASWSGKPFEDTSPRQVSVYQLR